MATAAAAAATTCGKKQLRPKAQLRRERPMRNAAVRADHMLAELARQDCAGFIDFQSFPVPVAKRVLVSHPCAEPTTAHEAVCDVNAKDAPCIFAPDEVHVAHLTPVIDPPLAQSNSFEDSKSIESALLASGSESSDEATSSLPSSAVPFDLCGTGGDNDQWPMGLGDAYLDLIDPMTIEAAAAAEAAEAESEQLNMSSEAEQFDPHWWRPLVVIDRPIVGTLPPPDIDNPVIDSSSESGTDDHLCSSSSSSSSSSSDSNSDPRPARLVSTSKQRDLQQRRNLRAYGKGRETRRMAQSEQAFSKAAVCASSEIVAQFKERYRSVFEACALRTLALMFNITSLRAMHMIRKANFKVPQYAQSALEHETLASWSNLGRSVLPSAMSYQAIGVMNRASVMVVRRLEHFTPSQVKQHGADQMEWCQLCTMEVPDAELERPAEYMIKLGHSHRGEMTLFAHTECCCRLSLCHRLVHHTAHMRTAIESKYNQEADSLVQMAKNTKNLVEVYVSLVRDESLMERMCAQMYADVQQASERLESQKNDIKAGIKRRIGCY